MKCVFLLRKILYEAFKNKDDVGYYSLGALKHDRDKKGSYLYY